MSTQQLVTELLALPLAERVDVAQALWQSIHDGLPGRDESDALELAKRRRAELINGTVKGIPHAEVMAAARRAIE